MCSETRKRCVLEREFDSPYVINDVNTNRLRYAGHMIRRPEDPKTYYRKKTARNKATRKIEISVSGWDG
jgi:hypothetical protein